MKEYFNKKWKEQMQKVRTQSANRERYILYRKIMKELKINGCAICGYNKCMRALHFHHVNPKDKKFNLMLGNLKYSNGELVEELNKCILLCSNCHMEIEEEVVR